jgi:hypothetical protein
MKELSKNISSIQNKILYGLSIVLILICYSSQAKADYVATGPIYAEDCYDFGIVQKCSTLTVTEVKKDGKRYEVGRVYASASYSNGRCTIDTKSRGLGPLSWGINAVIQPEFWGYSKDGTFKKIDADRIFFDCIQR